MSKCHTLSFPSSLSVPVCFHSLGFLLSKRKGKDKNLVPKQVNHCENPGAALYQKTSIYHCSISTISNFLFSDSWSLMFHIVMDSKYVHYFWSGVLVWFPTVDGLEKCSLANCDVVVGSTQTPPLKQKGKLSTIGKIFKPWKWRKKKTSDKFQDLSKGTSEVAWTHTVLLCCCHAICFHANMKLVLFAIPWNYPPTHTKPLVCILHDAEILGKLHSVSTLTNVNLVILTIYIYVKISSDTI